MRIRVGELVPCGHSTSTHVESSKVLRNCPPAKASKLKTTHVGASSMGRRSPGE